MNSWIGLVSCVLCFITTILKVCGYAYLSSTVFWCRRGDHYLEAERFQVSTSLVSAVTTLVVSSFLIFIPTSVFGAFYGKYKGHNKWTPENAVIVLFFLSFVAYYAFYITFQGTQAAFQGVESLNNDTSLPGGEVSYASSSGSVSTDEDPRRSGSTSAHVAETPFLDIKPDRATEVIWLIERIIQLVLGVLFFLAINSREFCFLMTNTSTVAYHKRGSDMQLQSLPSEERAHKESTESAHFTDFAAKNDNLLFKAYQTHGIWPFIALCLYFFMEVLCELLYPALFPSEWHVVLKDFDIADDTSHYSYSGSGNSELKGLSSSFVVVLVFLVLRPLSLVFTFFIAKSFLQIIDKAINDREDEHREAFLHWTPLHIIFAMICFTSVLTPAALLLTKDLQSADGMMAARITVHLVSFGFLLAFSIWCLQKWQFGAKLHVKQHHHDYGQIFEFSVLCGSFVISVLCLCFIFGTAQPIATQIGLNNVGLLYTDTSISLLNVFIEFGLLMTWLVYRPSTKAAKLFGPMLAAYNISWILLDIQYEDVIERVVSVAYASCITNNQTERGLLVALQVFLPLMVKFRTTAAFIFATKPPPKLKPPKESHSVI